MAVVEWLRGFSVLATLETARLSGPNRGSAEIMIFSRKDLVVLLSRQGFTPLTAERFIDEVCLRSSTRDFFDAPLVRLSGDRLILFGPAVRSINPGVILRSVFASRAAKFKRKGDAYEKRVISFLKAVGLEVKELRFRRKRESYQLDVVALWGDYIFVFECKNQELPGEEPVRGRHFLDGVENNARQVLRQIDGLRSNPQVLTEAFDPSADSKILVPCVLYNEAFSRPVGDDGVFHFDFTALERFFRSQYIYVSTHWPIGGKTLQFDIPLVPLWRGKEPAPEDLLAEMANPVALRILRAHTWTSNRAFAVDNDTLLASLEFVRQPQTLESMATFSGKPAYIVRRLVEQLREHHASSDMKPAARSQASV